ncbi:Short-chain dehydrogenase/reductase SDR [Trinorchestia longiramus]|nr:Short-chain dehydrogenase/reductase SDR [Trinorchestia longiramus]
MQTLHCAGLALHCVGPTLHCAGLTLHCVGPTLHCAGLALHCVGPTLHCAGLALHCVGPALHCAGLALHCVGPTLHCAGLALHSVCVADIRKEIGENTAAELAAVYGADRVSFETCDTSDQLQFSDTWTRCEEKLGKPDLLVNNAGVGDEQNWKKTVDINVGGYITGTLLAFERMRSVGEDAPGTGGAVVNISSIVGVKTLPFGPIYSATKSAIVGLSRSLGHPLHYSLTGVKVLCLCPSLISDTPFLQCAMENAFSPGVAKAMEAAGGKIKPLSVSEVVDAFSQLLDESVNGGVMVVEADKDPFYSNPELAS